jgi:hypothetical protein
LSLHLPLEYAKPAVLKELRAAMAQHPGEVPVTLHLTDSQFRAKMSTSPSLKVAPTEALMAHLQRLARPGRVQLS